MNLNWLDAQDATKVGVALADDFAPQVSANLTDALDRLFERADQDVRTRGLNFYKKAKFANSFKWRLLEKGVDKEIANDVTQRLVVYLSHAKADISVSEVPESKTSEASRLANPKALFVLGNKHLSQGEYAAAANVYRDLLRLEPRSAGALNNLGASLCGLGNYNDGAVCFRQAIKLEPKFLDPYSNLGNALAIQGAYREAESFLRQALKLNPRFINARTNLGLTLASLGNLRDATAHFDKALKIEPRNAEALFGQALVAKVAGDLNMAAELAERALKIKPKMARALATLISLRKMSASDNLLREKAEEMAASGVAPLDEAELRFAIGKHCDDVSDFDRAFQNYQRANELLKPIAQPYDSAARSSFVDGMIRVYAKAKVHQANLGASHSDKPVFVVGMPRSGTSLAEQIIASHPFARGAGELEYWSRALSGHREKVMSGQLDESTVDKWAKEYLRALEANSGSATRIVDKMPSNADYLGIIHLTLPNARIINMQRDPIDTCLSCYFQKFIPLGFTSDLADLADYYRQHERLMAHWRDVLPRGTMLDVRYEDLVANQEESSRKIMEFLGLDWNEQVLDFYMTPRPVATASFWQVRQKIYGDSVSRWRNYKKFIGPLAGLKDPAR